MFRTKVFILQVMFLREAVWLSPRDPCFTQFSMRVSKHERSSNRRVHRKQCNLHMEAERLDHDKRALEMVSQYCHASIKDTADGTTHLAKKILRSRHTMTRSSARNWKNAAEIQKCQYHRTRGRSRSDNGVREPQFGRRRLLSIILVDILCLCVSSAQS